MGDCDKRTDTPCGTNSYFSRVYSILQGELCQSGAAYIRAFGCHNDHAHLIRMSAHGLYHITKIE